MTASNWWVQKPASYHFSVKAIVYTGRENNLTNRELVSYPFSVKAIVCTGRENNLTNREWVLEVELIDIVGGEYCRRSQDHYSVFVHGAVAQLAGRKRLAFFAL